MRGMAAISATGAAGAAAAAIPPLPTQEPPVAHVTRLADELSLAMDAWMDDISAAGGCRALWKAHVFPASTHDYPVMFEDVTAMPATTPAERFDRAKRELIEAFKAMNPRHADLRIIDCRHDERPTLSPVFMIVGHDASRKASRS